MTDEERQRAMDFIVDQQAKNSAEIEKLLNRNSVAASRKLYRDMERLERVLKRIIKPDARERQRKHEDDKRWREFGEQSRKRFAEISAFAAVTDQKLKALIDDVRNDRAKRES